MQAAPPFRFPPPLGIVVLYRLILTEHLRAEVHELRRPEVFIGVEKLLARQFALAVLIVAIDIPCRIAGIGIRSEIIRHVGNDELRLGDAVGLEVLKMIVE